MKTPLCKCGNKCAYYGPVGGYSVKCRECNALNAERQRNARKQTHQLDVRDWWPCACVKRQRGGQLSHIKLNHPDRRSCRACGCKKPATYTNAFLAGLRQGGSA